MFIKDKMSNKAINIIIISYGLLIAKPKRENYGKDEDTSFWIFSIKPIREKNNV